MVIIWVGNYHGKWNHLNVFGQAPDEDIARALPNLKQIRRRSLPDQARVKTPEPAADTPPNNQLEPSAPHAVELQLSSARTSLDV